jgi:RNase P subunit RPR2
MVIASSGPTQIICDRCSLPVYGEYSIRKLQRNGHLITIIRCKGCEEDRIEKLLKMDELNDPAYFAKRS